ncbi:hypothetical protein SISSUDRAFT_988434 [Sistotremastrum suecicum HHB10207 ss-3]|uniref:CBM1 domain-containing protein n=1 Tax=Sistotremastrum suecicum HHB10207 ss-3 TaxID=1314776 RepID=A0A166C0A3_9AGAM|nr:hypothetical protein SISSUDRAFT_988434 [Sistotremastrum suecicum HHB10207 ss-3]
MVFSLGAGLLGLAILSTRVVAQSGAWGQCGGIGWSGATTCVSGYYCFHQNPYYYQCIPGTTTTTSTSTKTSTTTTSTTKSTSTSSTKSTSTTTSTSKTSSTTTTTSSTGPSSPTSKVNYWFSFGDSYSQTGFNITTGPLPSIGNPLGNPPYPGYTAVGGVNYVDLVTVQYNKSLVLNYNFAYGGATIDASLVTPYEPTVLSLTDQVNEYLNSIATKPASTPWTSANTLFSVWIGINDIGNSYYNGQGSAFNTILINAYFALVQKLYNSGARNFLFINVPPIDRSPLMLAQPAASQAQEKTAIADFNSQLVNAIASFSADNTGVTTWLWDSNAAFTTVLNSPTTYGFVDAISYGNTGDFWG